MSIIKTNFLILTLGLSLAAGHVQAGPYYFVKINTPEYKYGVPAAKVLEKIKIPMAALAHAIKIGAIKFDKNYRAELAKSPYALAIGAGYLCIVGSVVVICSAGIIAEKIKQAMQRAKENRAWKKEVLRKAQEAKDYGYHYVGISRN